jgi:predicted nucleotidyltransferase
MDTYSIEILNPKAKNILENMADLNLISIRARAVTKNDFIKLLAKLRQKSHEAPSLEEIAKEVKTVRKKRKAK